MAGSKYWYNSIQFFCTRIFSLLYSHSASRKASFKIESGVLKWQKGAMMSNAVPTANGHALIKHTKKRLWDDKYSRSRADSVHETHPPLLTAGRSAPRAGKRCLGYRHAGHFARMQQYKSPFNRFERTSPLMRIQFIKQKSWILGEFFRTASGRK